jgi:hypothetical protein
VLRNWLSVLRAQWVGGFLLLKFGQQSVIESLVDPHTGFNEAIKFTA